MRTIRSLVTLAVVLGLLVVLSTTAWGSPAPGTTITTDVTFDSDVDATGVPSTVYQIGADNITVDGAGHTITANGAYVFELRGHNGVTIKNFVIVQQDRHGIDGRGSNDALLEDITLTGPGGNIAINLAGDRNVVSGCTASAWWVGMRLAGDDGRITGCSVQSCGMGFVGTEADPGQRNQAIDNDLATGSLDASWQTDLVFRDTRGAIHDPAVVALYDVTGGTVEGMRIRQPLNNGAIRLFRCSGVTVRNCDGSGSGTAVRLYGGCTDNVIEDNDCRSCFTGISVGTDSYGTSANNVLRRNDVSSCTVGITLSNGTSTTIANDNVFDACTDFGIRMNDEQDMVFDGFTFTGGGTGIALELRGGSGFDVRNSTFSNWATGIRNGAKAADIEVTGCAFTNIPTATGLWADDVLVQGNTFTSCANAIAAAGRDGDPVERNVMRDNDFSGGALSVAWQISPLIEDTRGAVHDPAVVALYDVTGGTVQGMRIRQPINNGAIRLFRCSGVTVRNCDASSSGTGIRLFSGCSNVVLEDNDCRSSNFGITVGLGHEDACVGTVLRRNDVSGSTVGLNLVIATGTVVDASNDFTGCTQYGIYLQQTSGQELEGLTLAGTSGAIGIYALETSETVIRNCEITGWGTGLRLRDSTDCQVFNNRFLNAVNAVVQGGSGHQWNTAKTQGTNIVGGPYLGGNYWTNDSGTGHSDTCFDADLDGLCDTPYAIDSSNTDQLPLGGIPGLTLAPAASPEELWAPNHHMEEVTIALNANNDITAIDVQVASNEDTNNFEPDWEILARDTSTGTVRLNLRKERNGKDIGRVYTVTITVTDVYSQQTSTDVVITVHHDQG